MILKKIALILVVVSLLLMSIGTTQIFAENDKWIAPDKAKHFIAGFTIGKIVSEVSKSHKKINALLATLTIGVAKEVGDKEFSYKDLTANMVGCLFSFIIKF